MIPLIALLLAQSMPPPVYIPPAAPVESAPVVRGAEHDAIAMEIVMLCNSEALTRQQLDQIVARTLPETLAATPEFAALETEYPGLTKILIDAMTPEIVDVTIASLPALWARLMPIYAEHLTTAELRELLTFYRSPTGARLLNAMGRSADYSQMARQIVTAAVNEQEKVITVEELRAGQAPGIAAAIKEADGADKLAYARLATSSAGRKLAVINPKIQATAVAWGNEPRPEIEARMEKIVTDAMTTFLEKQGKKK